MTRKVDKHATADARRRHAAGIRRLNKLFAVTQAKLDVAGVQNGAWRPVRLRPNVPPLRTDEQHEKHARARRVRAARRRNRGAKRS